MRQPSEQLALIVDALSAAGVPYAVGGAIASGVWSEPRDTQDIDIDIFLPESSADRVFDVLEGVGIAIDRAPAREEVVRAGQVRLPWEGVFVDLFFAYDPFHYSCAERAAFVEIEGVSAYVLSAEDIVVFKTLFNRPRDWPDIESIIAVQGEAFDGGYALGWLERILGAEDSALRRLRDLIDEYRENPA